MYENLLNNKNAEVWTIDEAMKLYNDALGIAKNTEDYVIGSGTFAKTVQGYKYHFLGELAKDLDIYPDLFKYLKNKFKDLKPHYNRLKSILEANCFSDSKKGIIKEASAIMNLKSNYGWTDRVDNTTKGEQFNKVDEVSVVFKDFSDDSK